MLQDKQVNDALLDAPLADEKSVSQNGKNFIMNDTSIFFKGLFGMILCMIPAAIIGLVLIKMSLEQAKEAMKAYSDNPNFYRLSSIAKVRRGRTFAYIGLAFFILEITALMVYMSIA